MVLVRVNSVEAMTSRLSWRRLRPTVGPTVVASPPTFPGLVCTGCCCWAGADWIPAGLIDGRALCIIIDRGMRVRGG